ncbi:MAG: hypothetical protein AAF602_04125 [Myxococcota bacterium]
MSRPSRPFVAWLWHELTRPRGPHRHRFYRGGRRSKAGVALLMTITSVMLMSILVTEIGFVAVQRATVAAQYRDEVAAEYLAKSGLKFHHLVLIASQTIGQNPMIQQFAPMLGGNGAELWQAIPFIDTRFLRMVIVDAPTDSDDLAEVEAAGGLTDEQIEESRSEGSSLTKRSFLDFDGDFNSTVTDMERFINVRTIGQTLQNRTSAALVLEDPVGAQLHAMFMQEDTREWLDRQNLTSEELIGNLADWVDIDSTRIHQGGDEDALYDDGDDDNSYRTKNGPFDTLEEIRLVDGWHRDGVWERVGRRLTVYGSNNKVNVLTAPPAVLEGVVAYCAGRPVDIQIQEAVQAFIARRNMSPLDSGLPPIRDVAGFTQAFANPIDAAQPLVFIEGRAEQIVKFQSKIFRIRSVGEVGDARAEAEMIVDFENGGTGRIVYWNVR